MQYIGTAPYTGQVFKQETQASMQRSTSQPGSGTDSEQAAIQAPYSHPHSHSRGPVKNGGRPFTAPDALVCEAPSQATSPISAIRCPLPERPFTKPAFSSATSWRRPIINETVDKTQAVIDAIIDSDPAAAARAGYVPKGTPPPSGKIPDTDKKEYCTYWIRTGECDYTQQGCMYKHEMPDRKTLTKIGFRTVPRWWQERSAIRLLNAKPMLVGNGKKPHEWLKARVTGKGSSKDSESDPNSDTSMESVEGKKTMVMQRPSILKRPVPIVKPESAIQKIAFTEARKHSLADSDLIDFQPLLPTPPSSASSVSSPASTTSSPRSENISVIFSAESPTNTDTTTKRSKIFVPAGESPNHHIAEHHFRKRVPRSSPNTANPNDNNNKTSTPSKNPDKINNRHHQPNPQPFHPYPQQQHPNNTDKQLHQARNPASNRPLERQIHDLQRKQHQHRPQQQHQHHGVTIQQAQQIQKLKPSKAEPSSLETSRLAPGNEVTTRGSGIGVKGASDAGVGNDGGTAAAKTITDHGVKSAIGKGGNGAVGPEMGKGKSWVSVGKAGIAGDGAVVGSGAASAAAAAAGDRREG